MKFVRKIYFAILFYSSIGVFTNANAATYTVGTAGNYTTLQLAFADINNNVINGAITLNIISNITETVFPIQLNTNTVTATYASILIQPSGGAWAISGNVNGYFMRLNGAVNVTIDGLNTGGNSLSLENTSTGTSSLLSTIAFTFGANNSIIRNCTIKGSKQSNGGSVGGPIFLSTGSNHDITITNCNITTSHATSLPINGIYASANNYNVTISYCNISDYYNISVSNVSNSFGIYANSPGTGTIGTGGTQSWVIDHNNFFQSAARTSGMASMICGAIGITNTAATSFGVDITNNVIGHTSTVGSVDMTYSFTGIVEAFSVPYNFIPIYIADLASATTTNIKGNTIAGISYTTTSPGTGATVVAAPGVFTAISINNPNTASNTPTVNIGGTGANRVDGNVIGLAAYPIAVSSSSTLSNLRVCGIWSAFKGTCTIQNNTVSAIRFSETSTGSIYALGIALGYGQDISGYCTGNKINNLDFLSGTASSLVGIYQYRSSAATGWTIANNFISLITAYTVTTLTGFHDASQGPLGSINNYFFNSVYLGGPGSGTTSNGLITQNADASQEQLTVKNNIFYIDRAGSTNGYCINTSIAAFPPTAPTTWASDYNILNNPNSTTVCNSGATGYTLVGWRTAGGGDMNSFTGITPIFLTNVSTGDLHISWDMSTLYPGVSLAGAGTYPLGIDIDPQNRGIAPDIGADEYGSLLPVELLSFSGIKEGNFIKLIWKTANEINNDYFIIERSEEGKIFEEIARVNGAGTSSSISKYEFTDKQLSTFNFQLETIYYRLKQVDFDGKYEYFGPVSFSSPSSEELNFILHNSPVANELIATLVLSEDANVALDIIDLQGRVVKAGQVSANKGSNLLKIDLSNATAGIYVVNVRTGQDSITKKFLIAK